MYALEPHISQKIMELHHSKHHQTYITNLNKALNVEAQSASSSDLPARIANQAAIRFNGGGHINHSLFWRNLAPPDSSEATTEKAPKLMNAIQGQYGSFDKFKEAFGAALLGIQGSGWGWLVKNAADGRLDIVTTKDQDPVAASVVPIFGVDMWEHAYYLQYFNGKADYVQNIWNVINWNESEQRYLGSRQDAFKALRAVM
ncbi:Superoxide dismutase [Mn], mitochondrial [Taxawa tesnikishii (nom. ined.)]|nr:Superoxide dismutase [Mn], mitochondrial [Dothideales sp. JES 119]